jgi:hypothetical protein
VPKLLIQANNGTARGVQPPAVVDNIVRNRESLASTGLRCEYTARLLNRFRIASKQSLDLGFLIAIDDQYAVDEITQWRTGQQRNDD